MTEKNEKRALDIKIYSFLSYSVLEKSFILQKISLTIYCVPR